MSRCTANTRGKLQVCGCVCAGGGVVVVDLAYWGRLQLGLLEPRQWLSLLAGMFSPHQEAKWPAVSQCLDWAPEPEAQSQLLSDLLEPGSVAGREPGRPSGSLWAGGLRFAWAAVNCDAVFTLAVC